jgi:hypothetical protein
MPDTHMAYSDTRFCRYGFLNSGYGAEPIPDRTDRWVNFSGLRPKKRESWRSLSMDFVDHLTSFLAPTHTHVFGNHINGYHHLKPADVRSFTDCQKSESSTASKLGFDFGDDKNYDFLFKIVDFLIWLGSLMICTYDLTVLTKIKETTRYCESFGLRWQRLSANVSTILMKVSVPVKDE